MARDGNRGAAYVGRDRVFSEGGRMGGFGIDLGTANTVVCHQRRGVVLDEPSVMVVRASGARSRRVRPLLVGHEARDLVGRCPVGLTTMRPLHDGVIVDLEAARGFLVGMMSKVATPAWQRVRPRAVIEVPAGATALERRALLEVADEAGIRKPSLIPEPIAGALGCGLDPLEPRAHMVMDVGGGTSEITAFCYGGVLAHRSSRIAGDELTLALYRYLRVGAPAARRRADRGGAEVPGGRSTRACPRWCRASTWPPAGRVW